MVTIRDGGLFDPCTRGTGRPTSTYESILGLGCGAVNLLLQYYLLYGGGAVSFCEYIGYGNAIDVSPTQKKIMMILFLENELQIEFRTIFIFQSAVFSGWSIAFVLIFVRYFLYSLMSITAYMGYGLLAPHWYVIGVVLMAFFQFVEVKGDYDLKEFIIKKRARQTKKKVCTEKSWSISRHPNHLGFIYWWPPHALMATANPWTFLYVCLFCHFWIICVGIPSNEKYMLDTYGDEYSDYQSKVPKLYPRWGSKPNKTD